MPTPTPGTLLKECYLGADLTSGTAAIFNSVPAHSVSNLQRMPWPIVWFTFTAITLVNSHHNGPYIGWQSATHSNEILKITGPFPLGEDDWFLRLVLVGALGGDTTELTENAEDQRHYDETKDFKLVKWSELTPKEVTCAKNQLKQALETYKDSEEYVKIINSMQTELEAAQALTQQK